jgi:hypothetical protein
MFSLIKKVVLIGALTVPETGLLFAGAASPVPLSVLGQRADVVVVATIISVSSTSTHGFFAQLVPIHFLKGGTTATSLTAQLRASPVMQVSEGLSTHHASVGASGLWFLKQSSISSFEILPLAAGDYTSRDAFYAIESSTLAAAGALNGTVDRQILALLVAVYRSMTSPSPSADQLLLSSLDNANPQEAVAAIGTLVSSTVPSQHLIGLASSIHLGSDAALSKVAAEMADLQAQPKFGRIVEAIQLYYRPNGVASIAPLQALVSLHAPVPNLDAAVCAALQKIGSKGVLPVMAQLLDSQDPQAQLRAAWYFGYFALFADTNGIISGTGAMGPFASAATRQNMPRSGSTEQPSEYVTFWKSWWSDNRAKLSF